MKTARAQCHQRRLSAGLLSGAAIRAGGYLQLQGGGLNNRNGSIESDRLQAVLTGDLDNTRGRIQIAGLAGLSVNGDLTNDSGWIGASALGLAVTGNLTNRTLLAEDSTTHTARTGTEKNGLLN